MKKIISAAITAILMLSAAGVSASSPERELKDYPWALNAVWYCYDNNILEGDEFGDFNLGGNITRAQMARIFTDAFGLESAKRTVFSDVKKTDWFYKYSLALQNSMPVVFEEFSGGEYVTREEFAATLVKASGGGEDNSYTVSALSFKDADEADESYKFWLETAVKNLYMIGEDGYFRPKDLLTRAEACVFLYRVLNYGDGLTPIMAKPQATLEQAKAWAKARGGSEKYIEAADFYWYYGNLFGIRPDIMYAQAGKETGYGGFKGKVTEEMNNWAGIKTSRPAAENIADYKSFEVFETSEDGVRAHYNHMCAYLGLAPIGEVHDRYYVVLSTDWAGTIKYVEELGSRWYANIYYGYDILDMVESMLKY